MGLYTRLFVTKTMSDSTHTQTDRVHKETTKVCFLRFSIGKKTQRINELMWFFNVGLSGKDGMVKKRQMKTLPTILKDNNHTEV